jgi:hydrogenase maturation protein HypF
MLAYSPLHRLLLRDWQRPLVMTSGNRSDEPQCTDNEEARTRLAGLADAWLVHDRPIANRVDDSVAAVVCGQTRWLRRARGAAPAPLALPEGFAASPAVLALGGELKNTICLLADGQATLSQHLGDLEEARTAREFERTVALYQALFEHRPEVIAVDRHPDYHSSALGQRLADELRVPLVAVQHHAGHLASVLADAQWPADAGPVVALVLDGLGYGSDGTFWGGELLLGDYRGCSRIGHLRRSPLPGGTRAILEPWRTLYAQLQATLGWDACLRRWPQVAPIEALRRRPIDLLGRLIEQRLNAPETTSAGRLFDAVAAALGLCDGAIAYEAQAAIELETLAREAGDEPGYPFALETAAVPWVLDPAPMWSALLDDLERGVPAAAVAARFHAGFAAALEAMAAGAAEVHGLGTVALSGGVFQNRTLFAAVHQRLGERGLRVLSHRRVPTNDGGLSLGQAVAAALADPG